MAASPVVEVAGVIKRWGSTTALDGVTFEVGAGVTGLLGANGAGKTTLLSLVLGLHPPDAGSLTVLGRDPTTAGAEVRARVGYAPEHEALPPDVRAHDLVRHLAEIHGLPRRQAVTRANDVLWEVGLGEERFRQVGTMSTGQRQRVKLAQAIAHDPALVLLDEPTNGLDPVQRDQMLGLIRHVAADLGIDVLLSSHLLEEVERVSDAVVILDGGRLLRQGRIGALDDGPRELALDLGDDAEAGACVAELARRGVAAAASGRHVVVACESDAVPDLVRDALADLGASVHRLGARAARLSDVFLAAGPDR